MLPFQKYLQEVLFVEFASDKIILFVA